MRKWLRCWKGHERNRPAFPKITVTDGERNEIRSLSRQNCVGRLRGQKMGKLIQDDEMQQRSK